MTRHARAVPVPRPAGPARISGHQQALLDALDAERDSWRLLRQGQAGRWTYDGPADFALRAGQFYAADHAIALAGASCYAQALLAACHGWVYVEGFALGRHRRIVSHAWAQSPLTGAVLELHWPTPALAYLGVRFATGRAGVAIDHGCSVLDDWCSGWSLLHWQWSGEDWTASWPASRAVAELSSHPSAITARGQRLALESLATLAPTRLGDASVIT